MLRRYVALVAFGACAVAQAPDGAAVYTRYCARCHEADKSGFSPPRAALTKLPPEEILTQLHLGFMSMLVTISDEEKRAVASYLSGKPAGPFRAPVAPEPQGFCPAASSASADLMAGPRWNGWGVDLDNSRFQ